MLYVNEGPDPQAMLEDARARAGEEAQKWPYAWVDANTYGTPEQRGTVTGRLVLNDPEVQQFPGRILVGLAQPTYRVRTPGGGEMEITWQTDAKHYQFWVKSDGSAGRFTIPKVNPGEYTLYALADGVLGEFKRAGVAVDAGKVVDLGDLRWTPVRYGRQVWEIGIPNRTATEFAGGDRFFEPDITLQYPKLFPDDVTFAVGKSRNDKDWFFAHVPHNTDPDARVQPYRGVSGKGRATPYTIRFNLDDRPKGNAVLRLAICGTGTRSIDVSVNGKQAGTVHLNLGDGAISRHQIQGLWYERAFRFDASMLNTGNNTMTLTVSAGDLTAGVIYDYLRLEMEDSQ